MEAANGSLDIRMTNENLNSDAHLLRQALEGDEQSFVLLFRRWRDPIYRFSLRMSGCGATAEDVTQETFLALIRSGGRFNPSAGSFSSYLYGIARNHMLRRMKRDRIFLGIRKGRETEESGDGAAPIFSPDPLKDLTQRETLKSLQRAIVALPMHYREVVVLCEIQELSYTEAAAVIGCPEGTIRSRLHRARELLMNRLREPGSADVRQSGTEPARCSI